MPGGSFEGRFLCVDLSNYVMFAVGQPNHVYDADNLTLPLAVTRADTSVKVDIIGGNSVELDNGTPVIADSDGPVAVAGVIGGAHSAVTASSQRFVLETASFRPQPVRRTTQQLGLRTEASARFEKGLDTDRVDQAVGLFLNLLHQVAPTAVVAGGQDLRVESTAPTRIDVTNAFLTARIGQRMQSRRAPPWNRSGSRSTSMATPCTSPRRHGGPQETSLSHTTSSRKSPASTGTTKSPRPSST